MSKTWYERSIEFIEYQRKENPDFSNDELKKHCSEKSPWPPRQGWPYKAFLRAMRNTFNAEREAEKKHKKERCPNTIDMFSGC